MTLMVLFDSGTRRDAYAGEPDRCVSLHSTETSAVGVCGDGVFSFCLKESAAGRRQFFEPLELRAREEPARSCGARLPEGQSLQSTLRRGWYFGSQAFQERLLALLPKSESNVPLGQGQHYEGAALMREAAEHMAETIFIRELRTAGLTEEELDERPRSDPLKWKIATAMRTETTVPLKWIARRLDLGSDSNVCHKVNGSKFKS